MSKKLNVVFLNMNSISKLHGLVTHNKFEQMKRK